jgi:hypothetical protein
MYVDLEARTGANPDAARYLAIWKALSYKEKQVHMPEQICELATVPPADLIAWVSRQAWQEGSAKASMCMSFMRDKVLESTAKFAMASPDNYKHAELFAKVAGMTPQPVRSGGVTFLNQPIASSSSVAGAKSESAPVHASGLRSMDDEIVELSKIMQTGGTVAAAERMEDDGDEDDDGDDEEDNE